MLPDSGHGACFRVDFILVPADMLFILFVEKASYVVQLAKILAKYEDLLDEDFMKNNSDLFAFQSPIYQHLL